MKRTLAYVTLGAAAGTVATVVMERTATWLYAHQNEASRAREEELRSAGPTTVLARKLAAAAGRELTEERAARLGSALHYGFGASGGVLAALAAQRAVPPLAAGLGVALGMSVLVDEGANYLLGLTPPPAAWPATAHVRGALAHVVYGLVLGAGLGAGRGLVR